MNAPATPRTAPALPAEPPARRGRPDRGPRRHRRDPWVAAAFLAPSALVYGAFFFYPLYRLVHLAIFRQNNTGTREIYVGPSQLTATLTGDEFRDGLRVTGTFVLYIVPLGLLLGLLLALAAHRRLKGIRVFQTIFSSTIASSVAVSSVVFLVLINPQGGYFANVTFLSLSNPGTALRGVALSSVWQNLGLTFVIVLAGLQSLPEEVLEAAMLDGFGPVRRFFRVTLPLLSPTLFFLVIVLVIFAFQAYAQVDILTAGGPAHATETLVFRIVKNQSPGALGTGAGLALGLFGLTLLLTVVQFRVLERRVHYDR